MKTLLIIPFLFTFFLATSQCSITFRLERGKPITSNSLEQKLPLDLCFPEQFAGKKVSLVSEDGDVIALGNAIFGAGILTRRNGAGGFKITIKKDRIIVPGSEDEKVNFDKFKLMIEDTEFTISLAHDGESVDGGRSEQENYEPGYVYYDVFKLLSTDTGTKKKIFAAYGINGRKELEMNKFLWDVFPTVFPSDTSGFAQGLLPGSLISSLGNTDVTYFAEGLARFLAERTKEELNEAFFNRMREQLNAYPELKTVFPKTAAFLNAIETYTYASILQVLKEAFETDVQNLAENLYNIKALKETDCIPATICGEDETGCKKYDQCKSRLKALGEFFAKPEGHWVALGMFTVKEGIQSTNPADLLKSIVGSDEFTGLKAITIKNNLSGEYNITSGIELSNFLSQSLISNEEKQIWVTPTQLSKLFSTKNAFKVYLGLLLSFELREDNKTVINFLTKDSTFTFGQFLLKTHERFGTLEPQVTSLIKNTYTAFNAANTGAKKMMDASDKSVEADPQSLYNYYKTLTSSLYPIAHNTLLNSIIGRDIGERYDRVEHFLTPAVDVVYHITTKKYSAAIYDASILLSELTKNTDFKPVTHGFVKYGTLISTVASAKSSEEVKTALEASVLPVGSYSIKRKTDWSMSINAYVGAYVNYDNNEDYIPSLGLSAPIGFNISKGFGKTGNGGGLSLNLQVIDVGALVNYYLLKGDTASIPNDFSVKLSNIFAPGFNLCYNIPKVPLSIAWGGQYIPTLYKYEQINGGQKELAPTDAWRWQVMILVDIPMINLKVWDFRR